MLMGTPSRSRRNSTTPRYELRQISVSATITWRSHVLVAVNWNSTSSSGAPDKKTSSNAASALRACRQTNLRLTPGRQISDRRRSCQRLNGQLLAVTLRQHRRYANPEFAVHRHGDDNILIQAMFLPKKTAS